jgi:DNA-binding GntR family transcriptional regulator
MPPRSKKKNTSRGEKIADRIFGRLVEAIVTGELPSGAPLREARVAKRWGVSRTPMREAVRRVAEIGLVVLRHNQAPIIRSFSAAEINSLYELRGLLETFAFKQAFGQIPPRSLTRLKILAAKSRQEDSPNWVEWCLEFDRHLHLAWSENSKNPWLAESLARIWNFIRILQRFMAHDPLLVKQAAEEHRQILAAMIAGKKRLGLELLARHIRDSGGAVAETVTY